MESRQLLSAPQGFTLIETVAAAVIAAVVAGGTMIAFVTALNISRRAGTFSEAAHLAQQTLERFRNQIACDTAWFNPASCAPSAALPAAWTADPVSPPTTPPITRNYRVTAGPDSDGDGLPDYFVAQTRVRWTPSP